MNKENVYIELPPYVKSVDYWVNCFERSLTILFKDITEDDKIDIENELDKYYDKWQIDDLGYCCEEYMINNLSLEYRDKIVAIIYDNEEE